MRAHRPWHASAGRSAVVASRNSTNRSYSSCLACSSAVEDFLFVLFQLGRDVTLGVLHRLPAMIFRRHFVAMRVRDFQVIAKDVVEADFQIRDAGPRRPRTPGSGRSIACRPSPVRAGRRDRRESQSRMKPPSRLTSGQSSTSAASSLARNSGHRSSPASSAFKTLASCAREPGLQRRQRTQRAAPGNSDRAGWPGRSSRGPASRSTSNMPLSDVAQARQQSRHRPTTRRPRRAGRRSRRCP